MTRHIMAVRTTRWAAVLLGVASIGACSDAFVPDFNNPTIPGAISTQAELQGQASGLLAGDRDFHAFGILILETMGRDAYRIDVADPRYILQPLGQYSAGAFIVDFLWNANYRTIRGAQELVRGIDNSGFSAQDKAATRGFARTFQALQYLRLIETRDSLGVPIALGSGVRDPVRCKPAVLDHIVELLDLAAADLEAGGATFPFIVPSGFTDFGTFNTPATFLEFNRALAAKALTYKGFRSFASGGTVDAAALTAALTAIGESFAGTGTPLREGVYHTYSTRSGDATNFLYNPSVYRANPRVLSEADAGDRRLSKVNQDPALRISTADESASSDILFTNVTGPTTPSPILINEELLLTQAEIHWGLNQDAQAIALINFIRVNSGGLLPRTVYATRLDIIREIIKQKRYSLLYESGARFVDARMFGLFGELGLELQPPGPGPRAIPFPQAEQDARGGDTSCS